MELDGYSIKINKIRENGTLVVSFKILGEWGIFGDIIKNNNGTYGFKVISCWNEEDREMHLEHFNKLENKDGILVDALKEYKEVTLIEQQENFDMTQIEQRGLVDSLLKTGNSAAIEPKK